MAEPPFVTLKCPACGGALSLREGETHTSCPSCDSSVLLTGAVGNYVLPSEVGSTQALRAVRKAMESGWKDSAGRSRVSRPRLFYVPFWHISAQVQGYVLGLEPEVREEEQPRPVENPDGQSMSVFQSTRTVKRRVGVRAVEREVQLRGSVNVSAADLEPLGIPNLSSKAQMSLEGMEIQRNALPDGLEVFDSRVHGDGVFVDPLVSLSEARADAEEYLRRLAGGAGRGLEQQWKYLVFTGRRDCLIYYPLWVVGFAVDGRPYRAVVDGRSGRVLRGRFPAGPSGSRYIAAGAAALWAFAIPPLVNLMATGTLDNHSGTTSLNCSGVLLLIAGALGIGTWQMLRALDRMESRGGPRHV